MKPTLYTPEELRRRLSDSNDADAQRVATAIRTPMTMMANDKVKAGAYEELVLLAIQIAIRPADSLGEKVAQEVALSFIDLARESVTDPENKRDLQKVFS